MNQEASDTKNAERQNWTTKDWMSHVGAWETDRDTIEFGSVMAVNAMLIQFQQFMLWQIEQQESNSAPNAAMEYALKNHDLDFLHTWFHGNFDAIRKEWSDAPEAVFIGADPLYKPAPEVCSDGGKCGAGGYCITCPNMPAPEGGDK